MKVRCEFAVAPEHACLPGHFPDRPIVPAVVILQRAMAELTRAFPGRRVRGIPQAKFLSPLLPGEQAQLELEWTDPGGVRFHCTVGERSIATGRFQVEAAGAGQ